MKVGTRTPTILGKRQGLVLVAFVLNCNPLFHRFLYFLDVDFTSYSNDEFPVSPEHDHLCICNGTATNIQDNVSLSSPFFDLNDVLIVSGGNHSCCHGLIPDQRRHVFFAVSNLAYGHFIFNGMAPLWDKLHTERLLSEGTSTPQDQNALVLHLIAGKPTESKMHMPYIRQYLEIFGAEEVNVYSRHSFLEQRFLLADQPILGLANVSLDHYNNASSPHQWRAFRDFLIRGFPHLRHEYFPQPARAQKVTWRITFIQRKDNRKFINLDATIAELKELLQYETERNFTIREVLFEGMSAEDQAIVMSKTDILIGADGTGLMNGIYLPGKSCVIAVLPFGVRELIPLKGSNFVDMFAKLGIQYISLDSSAAGPDSHKIYKLAQAKKTPLERWFMLKQNLNVTSSQLVAAIQSCMQG